jgi:hypothetical protein
MEKDNLTNDYAAKFLADLEAQYAALGNVIASLRAARSVGALGGMSVPGDAPMGASSSSGLGSMPSGSTLPRGAFLGKKATEAITIYLSASRAKKTNREIGQALKDGGLESTGNFDNLINGALFQLKNKGTILRFDDGWGLAEWYPESFRNRVGEKAANPKKKKAKKKATAKKKAKTESANNPQQPKIGLDQQIMDVFGSDKNMVVAAEAMAMVVGVNKGAVGLALGRLRAKGKLEKTTNGYRLPTGNVQQMPKAG